MDKNVLNEDSEAVTTIEDALALVGGFGRFQWISSLVGGGNYVRSALFFYAVPFMELDPTYTCTSAAQPVPYECEPKQFCKDSSISYSIDWSSSTSLHNWVEQLDLTCADPDDVGFIGSSYFIGVMISVLILPRLSDIAGRKWPIIFC